MTAEMTNDERSSNSKIRMGDRDFSEVPFDSEFSSAFVIGISFVIRHSSFVIRHLKSKLRHEPRLSILPIARTALGCAAAEAGCDGWSGGH
jgi:hypothetical protein